MSEILQSVQQPVILKYTQPQRTGIQSHNFSRHGIGYILRGKKYIYNGDTRIEVTKGEMFYFNIGTHYTEMIPEGSKAYEEIIFFYTPEMLADILTTLNLTYKHEITNEHSCENCAGKSEVAYPAWNTVRNFFAMVNQYLKEDIFAEDITAQRLKTTELIYLITSKPDCCIKTKILDNMDLMSENFERTIQDHIFDDISIEELAEICNKSLTSFKKEFKKHFHESPHKWLIKQRLMHSRMLLISTNKSVSEIGLECNFPNTSHYIKLFKKEYGLTPAAYRNKSRADKSRSAEQIPVRRRTVAV